MAKTYDHLFKIILVGDNDVGKVDLLLAFEDQTLRTSFHWTMGVDFKLRILEVEGATVKLQLWDTAGQQKVRAIASSCFRGVRGVLLVYDVTNATSFDNIRSWLNNVNSHCSSNICKVLVGNKNDNPERKQVETTRALAFAEEMGLQLFEVSATDNTQTEELLLYITKQMLRVQKEEQRSGEAEQLPSTISLTDSHRQKKSRCT